MRLIRGMHNLPKNLSGCALTIGNFDGVHLGHQAILNRLKENANRLKLPIMVMLFEPQPREYFTGEGVPARLMRLRDKLHALAQTGVDYVLCIRFNQRFAELTAERFIEEWLVEKLQVRFLSIGDDFRFGAKRQGDFDLLQQAGKKWGFCVEDHHSFCVNHLRISSTAIREALAKDDLAHAQKMLGKPYSILGRVAHGNKLGRTIGFPTANIPLHRQVNPVKGVYAIKVRLKNGKIYQGVANLGHRPTINGVVQLLEAHLFDFNQNIYGQCIEVELCHKIRHEQKFPSFDELKLQISRDVDVAKAFFSKRNA